MGKYKIYREIRSFGFTATEAVNMLRTDGTYELYEEPCDCWRRHGRVLHNNGGNYHQIVCLHTILPWGWFVEDTSTREGFPGDRYDRWVIGPDGGIVELWGYWADLSCRIAGLECVAEFRDREAQFYPADGVQMGDFGLVRQAIEEY